MSEDCAAFAKKTEKYPAEVSVCITGVAFAAAGIVVFAISGAVGIGVAAIWVLAAIITVAGLGFIIYIIWDYIRYRRTPAEVVVCRSGKLYVLGKEQNASTITHVSVNEARGRRGPRDWGTLVLRSGKSQFVCRYVQDVKEAQARVVKFLATQRRQGESNV